MNSETRANAEKNIYMNFTNTVVRYRELLEDDEITILNFLERLSRAEKELERDLNQLKEMI